MNEIQVPAYVIDSQDLWKTSSFVKKKIELRCLSLVGWPCTVFHTWSFRQLLGSCQDHCCWLNSTVLSRMMRRGVPHFTQGAKERDGMYEPGSLAAAAEGRWRQCWLPEVSSSHSTRAHINRSVLGDGTEWVGTPENFLSSWWEPQWNPRGLWPKQGGTGRRKRRRMHVWVDEERGL